MRPCSNPGSARWRRASSRQRLNRTSWSCRYWVSTGPARGLATGEAITTGQLRLLTPRPLLVGYAFAAQELNEIPHADHDVPLDMIVTETGVRRFDN